MGTITCVIIGNVGSDPEIRKLDGGTVVCNFSVAVTKRWIANQGAPMEKTSWFRVTAWDKLARACADNVRRGDKVAVMASNISANAYANREGEPSASLEITAMSVEFMSKKGEPGEPGGPSDAEYDEPAGQEELPF